MKKPPVCVLLAGGQGTRLNALAWNRAKPAVPFAGIHRLIDFTISNSANSDIHRIGVLTQYLPLSLMDHVGDGSSWDLAARTREIKILPPQEGASAKDWYLGTAHAVYMNMDFIMDGDEDEVLILSGDHIYYMDYREMIAFHRKKSAEFTIATLNILPEDASRFGIAVTDSNQRIIEFQEKPAQPKSLLGSMGIYIVNKDVLYRELGKIISRGEMDIGGNLIPTMLPYSRIYAFPFKGYWRDVGTLHSYWKASMDLLMPESSKLEIAKWNIRTNLMCSQVKFRVPAYWGSNNYTEHAFISPGCKIYGKVVRSILSPGVTVAENAVVEDSILFHDVTVDKHCVLKRVISDKDVHFGENCRIGGSSINTVNTRYPDHFKAEISLFGKGAMVPPNTEIGSHSLIYPGVKSGEWLSNHLSAGSVVVAKLNELE